jgi:hypothetical protein
MFIRWIERRHKQEASAGTVFVDAYLTAAYRDQRGRPRNRTVCYLGNIRRIDGEFPLIERELFLTRAERILGSIADLDGDDVNAARQALHRTVAPLTAPEAERAFIANLQWYRRWMRQQGLNLDEATLTRLLRESRSGHPPYEL